jgi:hypothetical protein
MRRSLPLPVACAIGWGLLTLSCNDLVEEVTTDVCASGKRWVGEKTGSEEMYPGRDCVTCHRDNDGPAFLAAGTVYDVYDYNGAVTSQNDCFGLEGATVTISAADGQVFQTKTNRAGNFFFEGNEASLAMPFRATIEYELPDGTLSRQAMDSSPSYGGCAHCHRDSDLPATTDRCAGVVLAADEIIPVTPLYSGAVDGPPTPPPERECTP